VEKAVILFRMTGKCQQLAWERLFPSADGENSNVVLLRKRVAGAHHSSFASVHERSSRVRAKGVVNLLVKHRSIYYASAINRRVLLRKRVAGATTARETPLDLLRFRYKSAGFGERLRLSLPNREGRRYRSVYRECEQKVL
jgi:hypothetical protein